MRIFRLFLSLLLVSAASLPSSARHAAEAGDTIAVPPADTAFLPTDTIPADTLADAGDSIPSLPERIARLLDNDIFDRTQVGIYVYDLTADTLVFAHNERQCMRPASNQKVFTAVTALRTLGTDYRFATSLYATSLPADSDSLFTGHLYIKAGYDPLFDQSDMQAFADSLAARRITRITTPIRLDLTFKDTKRMGWGWCWDDDEVPLTPLLYRNRDKFVDALRRTLRQAGIEWDGTTEERTLPTGGEPSLICQRTHTVDQVLLPMMKNSDNSMAEATFYQIAAHSGRTLAGRKQAVPYYESIVREIGLIPSHYQVADGSGLSLYNYLTPELLGKLLRYAYRHEAIYRHLLPTLPVAANDGTLRKRMRGTPAAGNVKAKTGTVEGVSTLSGYCTASTGNTLCFSIMNQGLRYSSTGRNFQDRLCRALCK